MGISAGGVEALFYVFTINESIIKMIVDTFLFFLSYQIQMKWVFKGK
jgi:dolichol-phosphate mannosyltransferase